MTDSTVNMLLTLSALALAGAAVSLAGPLIIYFGTCRSKARNLIPALATGVIAAFLWLVIVDATPWPASSEPGSEGVSIPLHGWWDFYVSGLLWALGIIALALPLIAVAAALVVAYAAAHAALAWLSGYRDPDWEDAGITRAEALRRTWRLRRAERRFAHDLVDLLDAAARRKGGAISWVRDSDFVYCSTVFVMTPGADYYAITGPDIEAQFDVEQHPEITRIEVLCSDDAEQDPVSQSESRFVVRWNGDYLSRPLMPATSQSRTGAVFFGRWPLRDRLRRWAAGPVGTAVIVAAAMVLALTVVSLSGPDHARQQSPGAVRMFETPAAARPVSHLLQADQQSGEACAALRIQPASATDDPCAHAGIDGDRYVFAFDDPKVITAVAVNPIALKPYRIVRQVIWRFDGDPDKGYPATEYVQNIEPIAGAVQLRLDHGVRASTVTMIISDTSSRSGARTRQPGQGPGAITLVGYDIPDPDPRSGAGHAVGEPAPAGHAWRPGA